MSKKPVFRLQLLVASVTCILFSTGIAADSKSFPTALINVEALHAIDLSGSWRYIVDPLEMARKVPGLAGVSPWILKDFKSPRRLHSGYQDFWNRKGIVSPEGHKKAAFHVLRDWYVELQASQQVEGGTP